MAESASPKPGPNDSKSKQAVLRVLQDSDWPMTPGDVAKEIDYTRKTAKTRLEELSDVDRVEKQKIGGNIAYRMTTTADEPDTTTVTDGYGGRWGFLPVEAYTPLGKQAAIGCIVLAALGLIGHVVYGGLMSAVMVFNLLALIFLVMAFRHQDKADPNYSWNRAYDEIHPDETGGENE